jgi:von Willebrand factor type A domain
LGATRIRVDVAAYPTLTVSVVVPHDSSSPPRLYENGHPVRLRTANHVGGSPLVALVVDRSRSMRGNGLRSAVGVAQRFLVTKRPRDRIAVFAIGSKAVQLTGFSRSTRRAAHALRHLRLDPQPGTDLYDGIVRASAALRQQHGDGKVIILISDGQATSSQVDLAAATVAASHANASVYPVAIANSTYEPGALDLLARETGGVFLGAPTRASSSAYGTIAGDIRRTWRLVYITAALPGDKVGIRARQGDSPWVDTSLTIPGGVSDSGSGPRDGLVFGAIVVCAAIALLWLLRRPSRYATHRRFS